MPNWRDIKNPAVRESARTHQEQVTKNENDVISAAKRLKPDDQSDTAQYVREVAEDIVSRRAANN